MAKRQPLKRKASAPRRPAKPATGFKQENAALRLELDEARRHLAEALEQQIATADVLKIISRSTFDLQTVLDTLVMSAARLCDADMAAITRKHGDAFQQHAHFGQSSKYAAFMAQNPIPAGRGSIAGRTMIEGKVIHIADVRADPEFTFTGAVKVGGLRTGLGVPMLREGRPIGVIVLQRMTVRPFTDKEVELVMTFADQAVIAIENVRLFDEVRESLQQQTATADVLKVISRSTFNLQAVLDTLTESAVRLCEADYAWLFRRDGEIYRWAAGFGHSDGDYQRLKAYMQSRQVSLGRGTVVGRTALEGKPVHIDDVLSDPEYTWSEAQEIGKYRTTFGVPLLRDGTTIGVLCLLRSTVRPFSQRQIELAATFADQAVIAIENVRLFDEVQARTDDLAESLQQQTATADVLKVISRSTFDLQTVLDTLVDSAAQLCEADLVGIARQDGKLYRQVAIHGLSPDDRKWSANQPFEPNRGNVLGRTLLEGKPVHVADILNDPDYTLVEAQRKFGFRTMLGVPLLREGSPVGVIILIRRTVRPFTDKQVELASTFADQAVIAIENSRLLSELRERTDELTQREAELRVTFDNMGDGVVMFDEKLRLAAWNRNLQEILSIPDSYFDVPRTYRDYATYLIQRGEFGNVEHDTELQRLVEATGQKWKNERTRPDGRVLEVRHNPVPSGGFVLIYTDITERKRSEEQIRAARDAAESTLRDLRTAQDRLVQTEKLASLGQLTAGIAHEIKNPLNFVNNFSAISVDLVDELREALTGAQLDNKQRAEINELADMLQGNLDKVVQHGKRADSIVKNMLLHSRQGSGEHRPVNINVLVEESLNLAYHGARAEKQNFNISLERSFDPGAGEVDAFPQEITRVLLNLISNGFYAATKRKAQASGGNFEPTLAAATKNLGDSVEIRIRDNGTGIPPEVKEKMFNPFFTTKPAGEGTGLGLSLSHDIIVKQHAGAIEVDTRPGEYTEFRIILPRGAATIAKSGGHP